MVSPAVGKVVLVRFPFSDLSKSKLRPAAIVANAGRGDWILCQITSKPYGDPLAIAVRDESFKEGSLRVESFVRPGKLFTASSSLLLTEVGLLKPSAVREILKGIAELFRPLTRQDDEAKSRRVGQEQGRLNQDKIDEAVLALLHLGLHEKVRAWKGFDWPALNRLHVKGYISDPRGKAKSVVFTKDGLEEAQRLLVALFTDE